MILKAKLLLNPSAVRELLRKQSYNHSVEAMYTLYSCKSLGNHGNTYACQHVTAGFPLIKSQKQLNLWSFVIVSYVYFDSSLRPLKSV